MWRRGGIILITLCLLFLWFVCVMCQVMCAKDIVKYSWRKNELLCVQTLGKKRGTHSRCRGFIIMPRFIAITGGGTTALFPLKKRTLKSRVRWHSKWRGGVLGGTGGPGPWFTNPRGTGQKNVQWLHSHCIISWQEKFHNALQHTHNQ